MTTRLTYSILQNDTSIQEITKSQLYRGNEEEIGDRKKWTFLSICHKIMDRFDNKTELKITPYKMINTFKKVTLNVERLGSFCKS